MPNNPHLYNAVIAGITGGTQQRWITATESTAYTDFQAMVNAVAQAVDEAIPTQPSGNSTAEAALMQSITGGVFADRYPISDDAEDYDSIASAIIALYSEMVGSLDPTPSFNPLAYQQAPGQDGDPGEQGWPGPIGAIGPVGDRGSIGEMGDEGDQGIPGPQGPRGEDANIPDPFPSSSYYANPTDESASPDTYPLASLAGLGLRLVQGILNGRDPYFVTLEAGIQRQALGTGTDHFLNLTRERKRHDRVLLWIFCSSLSSLIVPAGYAVVTGPLDNGPTGIDSGSIFFERVLSGEEDNPINLETSTPQSVFVYQWLIRASDPTRSALAVGAASKSNSLATPSHDLDTNWLGSQTLFFAFSHPQQANRLNQTYPGELEFIDEVEIDLSIGMLGFGWAVSTVSAFHLSPFNFNTTARPASGLIAFPPTSVSQLQLDPTLLPNPFSNDSDGDTIIIQPLSGNSGITPLPSQPGPVGDDGPEGEQGYPGAVGPMGPVGPNGPVGDDGFEGEQGYPGGVGPMGPMGPLGPVGDDGPEGQAGYPGGVGPMGPTGPVGVPGQDGDDGQIIYIGIPNSGIIPLIQLLPSDDGADGDQGPPGQTGATGSSNGVPTQFAGMSFFGNVASTDVLPGAAQTFTSIMGNGLAVSNGTFNGSFPYLVDISGEFNPQGSLVSGTTHEFKLVNPPRQKGDRIAALVWLANRTLFITPAGWSLLAGPVQLNSSSGFCIFERPMDGTENGLLTINTSGATTAVCYQWLIRGSEITQAAVCTTTSTTGVNTTSDPPNCPAPWGLANNLFIGFLDVNGGGTVSVQPVEFASITKFNSSGLGQDVWFGSLQSAVAALDLSSWTFAPGNSRASGTIAFPPLSVSKINVLTPFIDVLANVPLVLAAALGSVDINVAATAIDPLALNAKISVQAQGDCPPFSARVSAANTVRLTFEGQIIAIANAPFRIYKET